MMPGDGQDVGAGIPGDDVGAEPERDPNTGVAIEELQKAAGAASTRPDLPRYRSHKIVQAVQIDRLMPGSDPGQESDGSVIIVPVERVAAFRVSAAYAKKHDPQPGGYYVRYTDGYESWSPAEAFESGHTPLSSRDPHTGTLVDMPGVNDDLRSPDVPPGMPDEWPQFTARD